MTNPIILNKLLHKENIYNKWKKMASCLRMYNVFMKYTYIINPTLLYKISITIH